MCESSNTLRFFKHNIRLVSSLQKNTLCIDPLINETKSDKRNQYVLHGNTNRFIPDLDVLNYVTQ